MHPLDRDVLKNLRFLAEENPETDKEGSKKASEGDHVPGAEDETDRRAGGPQEDDGLPRNKATTIRNILKIPTIWFSFMTFVVATACNGFLSINLEPQVTHLTDDPWR